MCFISESGVHLSTYHSWKLLLENEKYFIVIRLMGIEILFNALRWRKAKTTYDMINQVLTLQEDCETN